MSISHRAFPPPGAEQVTWQSRGESGFFGGFSDGEEAGIELHPGQTNGGCWLNSNQYGGTISSGSSRFDTWQLHVNTIVNVAMQENMWHLMSKIWAIIIIVWRSPLR